MPVKSEKQRKFFEAISHGMKPKSGIGPSKEVAEEFIKKSSKKKLGDIDLPNETGNSDIAYGSSDKSQPYYRRTSSGPINVPSAQDTDPSYWRMVAQRNRDNSTAQRGEDIQLIPKKKKGK